MPAGGISILDTMIAISNRFLISATLPEKVPVKEPPPNVSPDEEVRIVA